MLDPMLFGNLYFHSCLQDRTRKRGHPAGKKKTKAQIEKQLGTGHRPLPASEDEDEDDPPLIFSQLHQPDIDDWDEDFRPKVVEHPSEKGKEREVDLPDTEFEVLPMASTPEVSELDEDLPPSHWSSSSMENISIDVSCQSSGGSDIPIDSDLDLDQSEASSEGVSVFLFPI